MQICKKKIKNTLISTIEVIINEITKDYKAYILSFQDVLEENPDLFSIVVYDDINIEQNDEQQQSSEQDHVRMTNTEGSASELDEENTESDIEVL